MEDNFGYLSVSFGRPLKRSALMFVKMVGDVEGFLAGGREVSWGGASICVSRLRLS